eukprot:11057420-Heterocapsa_arctica.AAC.1
MNSDDLLNKVGFKDTGVQVKRENCPSKTKSPSNVKQQCLDKKEQMNSDNLLEKVDSKDTGVQGLLPTTTFAGKEPEGKTPLQEQSGTVNVENLPSKTESPSKFK